MFPTEAGGSAYVGLRAFCRCGTRGCHNAGPRNLGLADLGAHVQPRPVIQLENEINCISRLEWTFRVDR
jgi:hypothetical protein